MKRRTVWLCVALFVLGLVTGWTLSTKRLPVQGISARTAADYLHGVIEADRTFYTQHVVERMEAMLIVNASEEWVNEKTLPLPAPIFALKRPEVCVCAMRRFAIG